MLLNLQDFLIVQAQKHVDRVFKVQLFERDLSEAKLPGSGISGHQSSSFLQVPMSSVHSPPAL